MKMKDIRGKRKDFFVLCILFTALLTSCETLVSNVPPGRLPSLEEKLVISSFISPQDTLVKVYVSLSSPLFSEAKSVFRNYMVIDGDTTFFGETPFVPNADVFLKNGSKELKLAYNSREEYYFMIPSKNTIEISPNQKYELRVQYQDKIATAETTVPEMPLLNFEMKVDTAFLDGSQFQGTGLRIQSEVSFATQVSGYFRFRGYADGLDVRFRSDGTGSFNSFLVKESKIFFFDENEFIKTADRTSVSTFKSRGTAFFFSSNFSVNGSPLSSGQRPKVNSVYNEVMRITEPYYLYYESIRNYNSDNPFTEPTPIYGNIKGGLGIFASSNRIGKRINF